MNKIKQQFSQLRTTTPKYVQWLLLAAAFIVVLILLTMLLTGEKSTNIDDTDGAIVAVSVSDDSIDWSDVKVGEKKTQTIKITTTAPAIVSVRQTKEIDGFKPLNTCQKIGEITPDFPCTITLNYAPTKAAAPEAVPLFVDWRGADMPEKMNESIKITVVLGATAVMPVVAPEKKPEPTPVSEKITQPVKSEIKREIESIAPADPFVFEEEEEEDYFEEITPVAPILQQKEEKPTAPAATPTTPAPPAAESCSDFAFPGYDMSGNQMGWIRPERGAYYFHPFSDKKCDTPTGIYNPDNGIITDIKSPGKKIGTDAEHIGYTAINGSAIPQLSNAPRAKTVIRATQDEGVTYSQGSMGRVSENGIMQVSGGLKPAPQEDVIYGTTGNAVGSTQPYDRTFILRQYKPIPATIVSDVRADTALEQNNMHFPVQATVDRNVYSDNGRTIIIPTGTLMLGYVTGEVPGPYKAIGRMNIKWYQFVLPNGVEFNFSGNEPMSADSQGRIGVPGRGSTDYMEQFVMPMLTAIVPAAVNMIAPVADKFVNQIDLDNNTVVQSGTMRSSELAKNEIITAWNQVAQKLMVDMMDNTVPPFTIPAGTRITVYSPEDLAVLCPGTGKSCDMQGINVNNQRANPKWDAYANKDDGSWVGQSRAFSMNQYCTQDKNGIWAVDTSRAQDITQNSGYSYSTVVAYCQSLNYQAKNNVRQEQLFQNQQSANNSNSIASLGGVGSTAYNEQVLGMQYADEDKTTLVNPFLTLPKEEAPATVGITCEDGTNPDANGCCTGEIYTDMGEQGFNCCPEAGGDCFPPIL